VCEPTWLVLNSLASTPKADPRLSLPSFTSSPSANMFNRRALASVPPARREDIVHTVLLPKFVMLFHNPTQLCSQIVSTPVPGPSLVPPLARASGVPLLHMRCSPRGVAAMACRHWRASSARLEPAASSLEGNGINHCSHIISFRVILGVTVAHREHPQSARGILGLSVVSGDQLSVAM